MHKLLSLLSIVVIIQIAPIELKKLKKIESMEKFWNLNLNSDRHRHNWNNGNDNSNKDSKFDCSKVTTTTPPWFQIANHNIRDSLAISKIATFFNVAQGNDFSDNCLIQCVNQLNCEFFVWNQANHNCDLYSVVTMSNPGNKIIYTISSSDLIDSQNDWFGWINNRLILREFKPIINPTNARTNAPTNAPTKLVTTSTKPGSTVTTTTPDWYQWLGYDCSNSGGSLIDTINNVPLGIPNSVVTNNQPGNCLLSCAANSNCGFFVYNQNTLVCLLYSGTGGPNGIISGRCLIGQTGMNTGWVCSRTPGCVGYS